ncbi:hypothetical protein COV19_06285 [Candidatus Woesearchaeota archaeon CG10_big_fil_rev_8_21_14_0_10_44_13]|nr:MAG: hypothetical protein COV19_06285 [Candidatus Woesearchaeota archaeon CG10_big_fil_rev_8_21_14_0_10_44_13]
MCTIADYSVVIRQAGSSAAEMTFETYPVKGKFALSWFGSAARNELTYNTDLDFLVLVDSKETKEDMLREGSHEGPLTQLNNRIGNMLKGTKIVICPEIRKPKNAHELVKIVGEDRMAYQKGYFNPSYALQTKFMYGDEEMFNNARKQLYKEIKEVSDEDLNMFISRELKGPLTTTNKLIQETEGSDIDFSKIDVKSGPLRAMQFALYVETVHRIKSGDISEEEFLRLPIKINKLYTFMCEKGFVDYDIGLQTARDLNLTVKNQKKITYSEAPSASVTIPESEKFKESLAKIFNFSKTTYNRYAKKQFKE